ncbi:hypothetical protein IZ6_04920 [Terrihabitans soli]|uniref:Uncharacterized protein n=1 Tax=Terrihabitans soli TaxID=708113 RepID=A0A6S6QPA6_9HYPH|nr:hypothetical protein [Terrihabitans soli]BCJ89757.1 hypothetical protein IZ6_04920 [Terrihabitans soli]
MRDPKADFEELLSVVIPIAEKWLGEHGEFFPFGVTMLATGEIVPAIACAEDASPKSADIIKWLKDGYRSQAKSGAIIASILVYDVRTTLPGGGTSDAIAAAFDHVGDFSGRLVFPYQLSDDSVSISDPFLQPGDKDIFGI